MLKRWTTFTALTVMMFSLPGIQAAAEPQKPSADDIKAAKELVEKKMADLNAPDGAVTVYTDESLLKVFPGQLLVGVRFRQFPVARALPEGVADYNLFICKDGKLTHLNQGLATFFKAVAPAAKDDATAKEMVRAYLRLAQEVRNDGGFTFKLMDDSTKATMEKTGRKATGLVMATAGGNGDITVALDFDAGGKLVQITVGGKLKAGPRPICQATKLLDPDLIVRKMAEQDLLCMGRFARDYLFEQRAKASPELQQAIDRVWQRILDEE